MHIVTAVIPSVLSIKITYHFSVFLFFNDNSPTLFLLNPFTNLFSLILTNHFYHSKNTQCKLRGTEGVLTFYSEKNQSRNYVVRTERRRKIAKALGKLHPTTSLKSRENCNQCRRFDSMKYTYPCLIIADTNFRGAGINAQ